MHNFLMDATLLGCGATLTLDLSTMLLKSIFNATPSNFCLVGRWILNMPEGLFRHSNIGSAPQKNGECLAGWITHYLTGVLFAACFVALIGGNWLQQPTLIPALLFGMVTVLAPFFIMQPALGLGIAASKTANPKQARARSLINHFVFGVGLYLAALLTKGLL